MVSAGGAGALQAAGLSGVGQDAGLNGVRFAHLDGTAADDANGLLGAAGGAAVLGSDGAGNGSSGTGSLSDETRALLGDRAAELDDAALAAAGLNATEIAELRAKMKADFLADALAPGAVLSNTTSMQCCEPGCAVMSEIHVDPIFLRAGATCLMNFTVVQTDFDEAVGNDVERIEFIHVEGLGNISEGVKPGRNPCTEEYSTGKTVPMEDRVFTVIRNRNVTAAIMAPPMGMLVVGSKISPQVDDCSANGVLFDSQVTLSCKLPEKS